VCYDPYAKEFLSPVFRLIARNALLTKAIHWYFAERRFAGAAGEVIARTRYIDDYMMQCIGDGLEQLVIVGAGYDSRAYRCDEVKERVRVFEVDHPDTQALKKQKVLQMVGSLPEHVVYVPVEFSTEDLGQKLRDNGYDNALKTLFIWEGVTLYLTSEAVDDTLAFVANSCEGSSIIFDHIIDSVVDGSYELAAARRWKEYLDRIGEPVTFGISDSDLAERLGRMGFHRVTSVDGDSLRTYFADLNRGKKVFPFFRVVHATVAPRSQT
jgi:methyltransferase (TIGR00027 family)